MAKNAKKNNRRLATYKLQAEFLDIGGFSTMSTVTLIASIHEAIGSKTFLQYLTSKKLLNDWVSFEKARLRPRCSTGHLRRDRARGVKKREQAEYVATPKGSKSYV